MAYLNNFALFLYRPIHFFNAFFRSLENVIKSRDSISGFCKKAGLDRALLYDIFAGKRVPKVDTLAKIMKTLGYTLKVA